MVCNLRLIPLQWRVKENRLEQIQLQPSRLLAAILTAVHLAVWCLVLTLAVASWLVAGTALLLMLSAYVTISRHALLRQSQSIVCLELTDREHVRLQTHAGAWHSGCILGSSTVAPWLTVLNIRRDDQRWPAHVVLMGDSLDPAAFRRLRVWLRWGPRAEADDAATP